MGDSVASQQQTRKGTRSCVECAKNTRRRLSKRSSAKRSVGRQRKIKCLWPSEGAETCRNCLERRRNCVPQQAVLRDSRVIRVTSRDRIASLESNVSQLYRLVRRLEAKAGGPQGSDGVHDLANAAAPSLPAVSGDDGISDSDMSDLSPADPPTHLRQLFEDGSLGLNEHSSSPWLVSESKPHSSEARYERARQTLRSSLPSKDDVATIAAHAEQWLYLTGSLFYVPHGMHSSSELLSLWDVVQDPKAKPTDMAVMLTSLAVTVLQMQPGQMPASMQGADGQARFVREASDGVEKAIIMDDIIASTLEGLSVSLTWVRLQLVHTKINKVWINLRRVIALAEYVGLPKAAQRVRSQRLIGSTTGITTLISEREAEGAELWTAICAVDRLSAMMFSLPLGTNNHVFDAPEPFRDGKVDQQGYLCRLADIAGGIQDIDNLQTGGASPSELCEKVLQIDQRLRHLADSVPKEWWSLSPDILTPDHILQHFHQYIVARAHLQLALQNSKSGQFAYSDLVCTETCRDLARRYVVIRRLLPYGFFATRATDLQVLTTAIFLLNKHHQMKVQIGVPLHDNAVAIPDLVKQIVGVLDGDSERPGPSGQFARHAARTIRAISTLLDDKASAVDKSLSLRVPMLGRIDVRRKAAQPELEAMPQQDVAGLMYAGNGHGSVPYPGANETVMKQAPGLGAGSQVFNDWSMEISDVMPFLGEEVYGVDPWFSLGSPEMHSISFMGT